MVPVIFHTFWARRISGHCARGPVKLSVKLNSRLLTHSFGSSRNLSSRGPIVALAQVFALKRSLPMLLFFSGQTTREARATRTAVNEMRL